MQVYEVVSEFEKQVAEYAGARYGVSVNSCTNAIFLSCLYRKLTRPDITGTVVMPKHTYVGVAYSVKNAGYKILFEDIEWTGAYDLYPLNVIDSARRFYRGMFGDVTPYSLYCLSFHETKLLPIGDGGMILTDSKQAHDALRQMRFDGRTPGLSVWDDGFTLPAYHCHCKPDVATRGLMLMAGVKDFYEDLPESYPDLSQFPIFGGG